jgi:hypothetical protein
MTKSSVALKVAQGVSATLAAAAAGYYFYTSTKAPQHRKIAAAWAKAMKEEVLAQSKRVQRIGPKTIATIVDGVARTYRNLKTIDATELKQATRELKAHWEQVKEEASKTRKTKMPSVKKAKRKIKK